MRKRLAVLLMLLPLMMLFLRPASAGSILFQLPTETLRPSPTLGGPGLEAIEQVNVRSGPGTDYDLIGVLIAGQSAPALGRSPGGTWIQIHYPGGPSSTAWVFADLVRLNGITRDQLPTVQPPPTPTLLPTATLAANLTAGASATASPTRLPTYTPPPAYVEPTRLPADTTGERTGVPPALLIIALFTVGVLGLVGSFLRARR